DGSQRTTVATRAVHRPDATAIAAVITATKDNRVLGRVPIGRLADSKHDAFATCLGPGGINAPNPIPFTVASKDDTIAIGAPTGQAIFSIPRKLQQQIGAGIPG